MLLTITNNAILLLLQKQWHWSRQVCTIRSSWKIPFLVSNSIKFQKHFLEFHHESWIQLRESETDKKSEPKGCNHRWENSNFARGKKNLPLCSNWSYYSMWKLLEGPSVFYKLGTWSIKSETCPTQADLRPRVLILSSEPLLLKSSDSKSRRQRLGLNRWL